MDTEHNGLIAEVAWVTPEGILFNGNYYSCKRAIRDGWYGQALVRKPWMVRVLHDPAGGPEKTMYIESEQIEPDYACHLIRNGTLPSDTESYQARLRMLQKERKQLLDGSPSR
jgi:hypothetical protein